MIAPGALATALRSQDRDACARATGHLNDVIPRIVSYYEAATLAGTRDEQGANIRRACAGLEQFFEAMGARAPGDAGSLRVAELAFGGGKFSPAEIAFLHRLEALRRNVAYEAEQLAAAKKWASISLDGPRADAAAALDAAAHEIGATFADFAPAAAALICAASAERKFGPGSNFVRKVFAGFLRPNVATGRVERTAANAVRAARKLSRKNDSPR